MNRIEGVLLKINEYEVNNDNWLELEELIALLWESGKPEVGIKTLFRVFEKHPLDDGEGVFWSILHGLESLDYEDELYKSLIRKPSYMSIIMLNRVENTGVKLIAGKSILELKKLIKKHPETNIGLIKEL